MPISDLQKTKCSCSRCKRESLCWESNRHTSVSLNLFLLLFPFYVVFCTLEVPPDSALVWTRKKRGKYSKELASQSPVVLILAGCGFFSGALGVAGCLGCCWGCLGCCWGCLGAKSLVHPKQLPQLFEVSSWGQQERKGVKYLRSGQLSNLLTFLCVAKEIPQKKVSRLLWHP